MSFKEYLKRNKENCIIPDFFKEIDGWSTKFPEKDRVTLDEKTAAKEELKYVGVLHTDIPY